MSADSIIRATGLGKKYIIGHHTAPERYIALRDLIARSTTRFAHTARQMLRGRPIVYGDEMEEFWALKDVNFEIKRGEVVGLIGRNGAGKSTLLKILSRITEPSEGRVEITGRVASLLEVGTGFHPELSGRENIFLNGSILGMTRQEIHKKFDEIVAFAGIEKFLDTPVKRYSSGMYVRLAFAVAAHLEPEILIIDEVLAVGDAEFQRRCLGKMQDIASHGRTVIFVSHNMGTIVSLCEQAMLLSEGKVDAYGDVQAVVQRYQNNSNNDVGHARISDSLSLAMEMHELDRDQNLAEIRLELTTAADEIVSDLSVLIYSESGVRLCIADLRKSLDLPLRLSAGKHCLTARIDPLPLVEGNYDLGVYLASRSFKGEILSVYRHHVEPRADFVLPAPYPANARGFFDLRVTTEK